MYIIIIIKAFMMTEHAGRTDQLPLYGVVVALQQGDNGGLATAADAHQCRCLASLDVQAESLQHLHLWTRWVVKLHRPELNVSLGILPIRTQSHSFKLG